jgi:gluconate kinase
MIYVLFGEMGIGKNYVGEKLAEHLGCIFFDGDDVLPPDLQDKVRRIRPLSRRDIDRFVTKRLIPALHGIAVVVEEGGSDAVVAQALYMRKHRQEIVDALGGPEHVRLIHLPSPSFLIHMGRLLKRRRGIRWMLLGLMSKPFFQKPPAGTAAIMNRDGLDLTAQFRELIA